MHQVYKKKLAGLHLPRRTLERVEPILSLLLEHAYKTAEREIALLFVESIKWIKNKEITPKEADAYFTILGILISPKDKLKLSKEAQDILFVGELFHDAGAQLPAEIREAALQALAVLMGSPTRKVWSPAKTHSPVAVRSAATSSS